MYWSNVGIASWYDLSFFIGEIGIELGLIRKKAKINPVTSEQYITKDKRLNYNVLDTIITRSLLNLTGNHWQIEIKNICKKIKKENLL